MIFEETLSQWDHVAGMGPLIRTRLVYESVETVVRSHGFELSANLLDRIRILEGWQIQRDNEQRESSELSTWTDESDPVN